MMTGSCGGPPRTADSIHQMPRRIVAFSMLSLTLAVFSSRPELVTAAEKLLILKMVIKCADIGNVTKGRAYCIAWTERVVQEFFEQGDAEKRLKLPVTPMMDRDRASVPKQQIGFYNFVVKPMYEAFAMLVPLERQFENLDVVMQYWREKLPVDEQPPQLFEISWGRWAQDNPASHSWPVVTPTRCTTWRTGGMR